MFLGGQEFSSFIFSSLSSTPFLQVLESGAVPNPTSLKLICT